MPEPVLLPLLPTAGNGSPPEHGAEDETRCLPACWSHIDALLLRGELLLSIISYCPPPLQSNASAKTQALAAQRAKLAQRHLQQDTSRERSSSQPEDTSCRFKQLAFPKKTPIFFPLTPHGSSASVHRVPACSIAPCWACIPPKGKGLLPASPQDLPSTDAVARKGQAGTQALGISAGGRKQQAAPAHRDRRGNLKQKTPRRCPRKGKQPEAAARSPAAPGKRDTRQGFANSHPAAVTLLASTDVRRRAPQPPYMAVNAHLGHRV